jgi:hypothetical protein
VIWLAKYWKPLAVLVLLAAVYYWGWSNGREGAELDCLKARNADYAASQELANELNQKLQEALKVKSAPKIKEVIRANPSGCSVPKPVADGLREAIRSANAAQ